MQEIDLPQPLLQFLCLCSFLSCKVIGQMNDILVVGVGNPYVSDDGVGCRVLQELRRIVQDKRIAFVELDAFGLEMLEQLRGFKEAVIVDAAKTGSVPIGCVRSILPHEISSGPQTLSLHTLGLQSTLGLGSMLGLPLPQRVSVLAVEVSDTETFHEGCTPAVEAAIPNVVDYTVEFLKSRLRDLNYSPKGFAAVRAF
jgi:hydrogenase maturation protease